MQINKNILVKKNNKYYIDIIKETKKLRQKSKKDNI